MNFADFKNRKTRYGISDLFLSVNTKPILFFTSPIYIGYVSTRIEDFTPTRINLENDGDLLDS